MEDYGDTGGGKMKVVVFGASGIIGQHLRLCCPDGVEAVYVRKTADCLHVGLDLTDIAAREAFLARERPYVIVNLAGVSNPDKVEWSPDDYSRINVAVPVALARWCDKNCAHLVHVSTQAVFSGNNPPYNRWSQVVLPANRYGLQKAMAEQYVTQCENWTIVRPTFVLGIRPLPKVGRPNPLEQMISGEQSKQVNDRWFSVSLAGEVAVVLWGCVIDKPKGIFHIGSGRFSRYDIARHFVPDFALEGVSHNSFPGIAQRPLDTTYAETYDGCLERIRDHHMNDMEVRSREIALFLCKRNDECLKRLKQGWDTIHNAVSEDWNASNPRTDEEILEWYRRTETYIWELSYYHADPGWNYSGMVSGIVERLRSSGARKVLCLGDGIGDVTLALIRDGFDATYHDLQGSRTAEFAAFRSWLKLGHYMPTRLSAGWEPDLGTAEWDAIVSLDFLEHVKGVPVWADAIYAALKPGGLFVAQNAYGIGSGPDGSMPMHLAENDRYEKEWDPLLFSIGFKQLSSNWYQT